MGYYDYDTKTKITGEHQLLLDYGKIIKLVTFLNRNELDSRILQLQENVPSKIGSISRPKPRNLEEIKIFVRCSSHTVCVLLSSFNSRVSNWWHAT